ncbi:hypothetical protein [Vibrio campbellii]|nr:hypothetical protein [Vibrio campbellii]
MEKYCPVCQTEMIDRSNYFICPRNNIGECAYDGYEDHHSHCCHDNQEHTHERELVT